MKKSYQIPGSNIRSEIIIKKSRFICDLIQAQNREEAKKFIARIKEEFPDARHHCFAFIAGPPDTGDMGMSDDGEPQGTAGKPMLQVLQGSGLGDVAVVVTRYFGGILLGTGGLLRAYSGAVQQALEEVPVVMKVPMTRVITEIEYSQEGLLRRMLDNFRAEITDQTFGNKVSFTLLMPSNEVENFVAALTEKTNGGAETLIDDEEIWSS